MRYLSKNILNKEIVLYLLTVCMTIFLFAVTYRLWRYDYLSYPLTYFHDGVESLKAIKHLSESSSHWTTNTRIGFPSGSNLYVVFPQGGVASLTILRIFSLFNLSVFQIYNFYVFSSYLLVALSSLWGMRQFHIKPLLAVAGSLLFAFLPFHQLRTIVGHMYMIHYFGVPLTIYIAFFLSKKDFALKDYLDRKSIFVTLALLGLISSTETVYFTFFSLGIWIIASGLNWFRNNNVQAISALCILIVISTIFVALNLAPAILHTISHRTQFQFDRNPAQIEELGLRLNKLLIPNPELDITSIGSWLEPADGFLSHEHYQFIGIFGVIGFSYILSRVLMRNAKGTEFALGALSLGIVIWASTGGFAYPLGVAVSASIRSFGRISIYIAYMSILGGLLLAQRYLYSKKPSMIPKLLFLTVVAVSLYQQISVIDPHVHYWKVKNKVDNDTAFMSDISQIVPEGSAIFQLPIKSYPEAHGECLWDSYDHFYPYLLTDDMVWSFGAVKGSQGWLAKERLIDIPIQDLLPEIRAMGFYGIWIDNGSCIDGFTIANTLSEIVDQPYQVSNDQRYIYITIFDQNLAL